MMSVKVIWLICVIFIIATMVVVVMIGMDMQKNKDATDKAIASMQSNMNKYILLRQSGYIEYVYPNGTAILSNGTYIQNVCTCGLVSEGN